MKTTILRFTGLAFVMMSLSLSAIQCSEGEDLNTDGLLKSGEALADTLDSYLSEDEVSGIMFMREEEKVARDVYLYLYEMYPLRPFLNISKSEQAHMDAIQYLIETYELEDPVGENPAGVFSNEDLQQMYNELIETGSKSKVDALKVGALIEEVDILDLMHELDNIAVNDNVRRVYTNLCNASENHLRAFVRVLRANNVDYTPVKLDQALFDRILNE